MLDAAFWYPPLSPAISAADNNLGQGGIVVIPCWSVFLPLRETWDTALYSLQRMPQQPGHLKKKRRLIASTLPGDNHTRAYFPADCQQW